ncbi:MULTISPECIES: 5-dehydro-4-deoxy-D-glucuronate isomerase [unclassified Pseudoalteromonas]|uniref:5-dehydro-4-deoxy-D-glucuronate isomerase n=1 Tax=unclassified Pseudoalteromonas TaxID=194690 RepID=UPI0013FD45EF|nr:MULTISPECIES: 5-dehydro-4-deoxy-D-glucuronate isomerase [unclassified Pseudoalteromonas]MBH0031246.1 5-dehydro-4-deoxy-D-glucuronate isomerase [Pseudoalteromonas sp. SWYJZ98]WMS92589.1 5-dehydro-4-deoxy-D-glucuronate isomerase [Pseudoalteromonas sp. HL-AS1]
MNTQIESRYAVGPNEVKGYDTQQLRDEFLVDKLMQENTIYWLYTHYERFMVGSAVPTSAPLRLETVDNLKAANFLTGRELGVINVGGSGTVTADGEDFQLGYKDALYLGKDTNEVLFTSHDSGNPAKFYLNSAPAHHKYPNKLVTRNDANVLHLGALETSNERDINQMLINTVVQTCQLQMGLTELKPGSVWNTMPAHQHDRRNEVYFYFEVPEQQAVCHFMGEPTETRHIWVHNEQAVVSPPWSIHSGAGTQNYSFIWGMAGENLDYDDMDKYQPGELR